jgi:hypothetical protein
MEDPNDDVGADGDAEEPDGACAAKEERPENKAVGRALTPLLQLLLLLLSLLP